MATDVCTLGYGGQFCGICLDGYYKFDHSLCLACGAEGATGWSGKHHLSNFARLHHLLPLLSYTFNLCSLTPPSSFDFSHLLLPLISYTFDL
jgi:hypothetical protein